MWGKHLLSAPGPDGFPRDLQVLSVTQTSGLSLPNGETRGLELCVKVRNWCLLNIHSPATVTHSGQAQTCCAERAPIMPLSPPSIHAGSEANNSYYLGNTFYVSGDMQSALYAYFN